jgi:tripartite ATP-independent transporter DctM subunit
MGMLATGVGVSTACYDTLALWLGKLKGGLGVATIWSCAAFGTLNGSALVTASVFSKIAAPEMIRYGYNRNLTYGMIAAAGNIGQFIPPSVLIVIYGALSGDSIGKLLMAGIAPGIGLGITFSIIFVMIAVFRPDLIPQIETHATWRDRFISLKNFIPVVMVALIIIGGIFFGVFSSAEAGAIGCVVFLIYGIINKIPLKRILDSILETVQNAGMLFLILACSAIFAKFMTVSGLANSITSFVIDAQMGSVGFLFGVLVVLIILGCFIDAYSSIALTLPLFYPVAIALGIDPIHFAMVVLLGLHCGGITPPVGLCVFCVKSVAPSDVDVMGIFKGALPFLFGMIVLIVLFILFPSLSTFIPNAMFQ